MTIEQVWKYLDQGLKVKQGDGYAVFIEEIIPGNEYQLNHFTRRGNQVLSIRYESNYFGSLMDQKELSSLTVGTQ